MRFKMFGSHMLNLLKHYIIKRDDVKKKNMNIKELKKKYDYFESFESCQALISESGELGMEEAIKQGIQTDGKDKVEIAREIFSRQKRSLNGDEKGGDEKEGKTKV